MRESPPRVSRKRRQVMIAAAATGAALPIAGHAGRVPVANAHAGATSATSSETMVVSGRVLGADGRALAGVPIELSGAGDERVIAVTDGDGRFLARARVAMRASGRPDALAYRVLDAEAGRPLVAVGFRAETVRPGQATAYRDEHGTWRAAMGVQVT